MRKITQSKALELLKAAGVQAVEVVSDDEYAQHLKDNPEDEDVVDTILAEIDDSRGKIIRPTIEKELKDTLDKRAQGSAWNGLRASLGRKFKSVGVTAKELEDCKNPDEMMELCMSKYNEQYSQDTEGLRNELTSQQKQWESEKEALLREEEQKRTELQAKFTERDIDAYLMGRVGEIPRSKGNDMTRALSGKSYLREIAHIHWNEEAKKVELRDKNDINLPYMGKDGKKRIVEVDDALKEYATDMGWAVSDMRHVNPTEAMANVPNGERQIQQPNKQMHPVNAVVQDAANWGK